MIQQQNLFDYLLPNFDLWLAIDSTYHINIAYYRAKSDEPGIRLDSYKNKSITESFPEGFASLLQEGIKSVFSHPHSNAGLLTFNYLDQLFPVQFNFVELSEGVASGTLSLTDKETRTDWLVLQRNLAWRISEATDLESIFSYILRVATLSGYMDGGGIYLINDQSGALELKYHIGLSEDFVHQVNSLTAENTEWQTFMAGQPFYVDELNRVNSFQDKLDKEGIKTFASIPIMNDEQVIGSMQLVSYRSKFISALHKRYMEDLTFILADAIKRQQQQQETGNRIKNYRELLESLPDQLVVINFDGKIQFVNHRLCSTLGYLPDELIGENISRFFILDDHKSMINIINDLSQEENSEFEITVQTKSGELINMESHSSHSKWDLQNILLLSCREISQKSIIHNFNFSTHFEEIIEMIPIPAFIVEATTLEIKHHNLLFNKKYALNANNNQSASLLNLFEDFEQDRLITTIRQQGIFGLASPKTWVLRQSDGAIMDVELEVYRIPWSDKETWLVYILQRSHINFSNNLIQEDRYRDVVDEQLDIICRISPDGFLTFVNNAYCDFFNRKPEEVLGHPFSIHILQDDMEIVSGHLAKISKEHPVRYSQNRMIDGKGRIRWINWVDRGIYKDDELMEIQGVGRDITDDMNKKINSDSLEKRYQNLIDEMPVVIYLLHVSTLHPLYVSPHIFMLTGYSMDEVFQTRNFLSSIIHPDDKAMVEEGYDQLIGGRKNVVLRYRIIHKDGHLVWLQDMGSIIEAEDGSYLLQGMLMEIGTWYLTEGKMAIVQKFELFIEEITDKLLVASQNEWPHIVNNILETIGDLIQADRSYIFEFNYDKKTMSNTFEWCANYIEPQIQNLKDLPLDKFKFFIDTLTEKEIVVYASLSQIPESEIFLRQHLEEQDIQSILVVPMKKQGNLCGYLGFDSVQKEVSWDEHAIFLLRMVSDLLIKSRERLAVIE